MESSTELPIQIDPFGKNSPGGTRGVEVLEEAPEPPETTPSWFTYSNYGDFPIAPLVYQRVYPGIYIYNI